jgi:hypothetical protein
VSLLGIKVVVDSSIPDGECQLRDGAGRILGKIITRCDGDKNIEEREDFGLPCEKETEDS